MARRYAFTILQTTQIRYFLLKFSESGKILILFSLKKNHSLKGFYRPRKLGLSFPRLYDIPEGEAMASALLQVR